MADDPYRFGIGFARQQIWKFVKGGRSMASSWEFMRSKYIPDIAKSVFQKNFREIKRDFDFQPLMARLDPTEPVRRFMVNPTSRLIPNRYEYRILARTLDAITGDIIPKYMTVFSEKLLSLTSALELLREKQGLNPDEGLRVCPVTGEDEEPPQALSFSLSSVSQFNPAL
jgi:hypothetical protein